MESFEGYAEIAKRDSRFISSEGEYYGKPGKLRVTSYWRGHQVRYKIQGRFFLFFWVDYFWDTGSLKKTKKWVSELGFDPEAIDYKLVDKPK